MNEQIPEQPAGESAPSSNPNRVFLPIGITFVAVGITFLFNPEMSVVGWTFLPVGFAFLMLGLTPGAKDADGAGADQGPGPLPSAGSGADAENAHGVEDGPGATGPAASRD